MSQLRCPTCGNSFDSAHSEALPFCSHRCRNIDLGRWLDEEIRLPVVPDPEDDEEPPPQPPANGDDE
jgi:endogenous inhibitor of DNA gyrase (YacG/DUF329 family)